MEVEIGTPVAADTVEGVLVGSVIDMSSIGTGRDPVRDEMGHAHKEAGYEPVVHPISDVVLATVQVFSSPLMRPARSGVVRAATKEEMLRATGFSKMDWAIPSGVVSLADSAFAKVCLDGKALLGPESAHLIVNGLSGQAAKTSYAGVLLASAMASGGGEGNEVAALIFNVKGDDLIYLDQAPTAGFELQENDLAMYEELGIPAKPFENVTVYAPSLPGGEQTQSNRADAVLLRWGLEDVWPYLEYILPYLGDDEKASSFLAEFAERKLHTSNNKEKISSFNELDHWFGAVIGEATDNGNANAWGNHHVATMRRMRRMLIGIVARCGGLVSRERASGNDIPIGRLKHGQVIVVDIAGLREDIQGLVIGRTLRRVLAQAENEGLGVDHLVVFADELNAYAPSQGSSMAKVRKILQRVSTQGRYAGVSLWGLCQKMSQVDELVRDNVATKAIGITADGELASGVYGRLARGLLERLATLPKGSMALWHYSYRGALVVQFPRPAWRTGKPKTGTTKRGVLDTLKVSDAGRERLLEGTSAAVAERIISDADNAEDALAQLARVREPDMRKTVLHAERSVDDDDIFAIDTYED